MFYTVKLRLVEKRVATVLPASISRRRAECEASARHWFNFVEKFLRVSARKRTCLDPVSLPVHGQQKVQPGFGKRSFQTRQRWSAYEPYTVHIIDIYRLWLAVNITYWSVNLDHIQKSCSCDHLSTSEKTMTNMLDPSKGLSSFKIQACISQHVASKKYAVSKQMPRVDGFGADIVPSALAGRAEPKEHAPLHGSPHQLLVEQTQSLGCTSLSSPHHKCANYIYIYLYAGTDSVSYLSFRRPFQGRARHRSGVLFRLWRDSSP